MSKKRLSQLAYKHYSDWRLFENKRGSPIKWLEGSFSVVRALVRDVYEQDKRYGARLLNVLKEDLIEFEKSLKEKIK